MSRLVIVGFLLISFSVVNAGSYSVEDQIKDDIVSYVEQVFGEKEPTVAVYFKFHGNHDERESVEARLFCKKHFPIAPDNAENQGSEYSQECLSWIKDRAFSPSTSDSLFYKRIRRNYSSLPFEYEIVEIITRKREIGDSHKVILRPNNGPILKLFIRPDIDDPTRTRIIILE